MVVITKEDWDYINSSKGGYIGRGANDVLVTVEKNFGVAAKNKIIEELLSFDIDILKVKENSIIPVSTYMTLLVVKKQVLNLDEDGLSKMGRETAKLSFLLKYASRLLISLDTICKNANVGWHKYYKTGELVIIKFDKEEGKIVGEVRDFTGHPAHCKFIEGYFSQMIFFVTGKEVSCYEEECIFKGGKVHRYVMTFS